MSLRGAARYLDFISWQHRDAACRTKRDIPKATGVGLTGIIVSTLDTVRKAEAAVNRSAAQDLPKEPARAINRINGRGRDHDCGPLSAHLSG